MRWHFIWQKAPSILWAFSRTIFVFQLHVRDYNLVIAYGETYGDVVVPPSQRFMGFGETKQITPTNRIRMGLGKDPDIWNE